MAKRSKKTRGAPTKSRGFVIVTFAEDMERAREYESLLKTNNIPVTIKGPDNPSTTEQGVAVMVPEDYLDEAHVVIESQNAYDDFYDFAMESDENRDGFDDDFLDDNF